MSSACRDIYGRVFSRFEIILNSTMRANERKTERIKRIAKIVKIVSLSKKKNKKSLWSRNWLLRRDEQKLGSCAFVQNELLLEDPASYRNYLRMNNEQFEKLHKLIERRIQKTDTNMRQCIPSRVRLMVTLQYLATGESFTSLSYSSRISRWIISKIIFAVLTAIYEELKDSYLKVPSSSQEWVTIADKFLEKWNIPNTIGAMYGKHVVFRAPRSAGSHYYNYKGTHSIVLLAIVDADSNFIYIDVGTNGRVSDGGVYEDCDFAVALNRESLNLPQERPLPGMIKPVPYVLLADAAFPLQEHILKPFPFRNMSVEKRIYNYRLSRGRRIVEDAFGLLANRFRVLLSAIPLSRDKVVVIIQACCVLHNFIKIESGRSDKNIAKDLQRDRTAMDTSMNTGNTLTGITTRHGRPSIRSIAIRDEFQSYFSTVGAVPWQNDVI